MGNHGRHGPTTLGWNRSGSGISKSEAGSLAQIAMLALLLMSGIGGMGIVIAYYGKVLMRQLDEKVQLLDGKLMAISKMMHLVQRLVDLRGWVLMRWGDEPCHALSHAHEEGQDEGLATH